MADLKEKFIEQLARLCPGWAGRKFLVALSGGLDSTALASLAAEVLPPENLAAAHLNHRLRPTEAGRDQAFAMSLAAKLGLEFFTAEADVAALARQRRKGVEEAARRARYDFLTKTLDSWGGDFILTAHHADDQAETMLMNFLKGAGAAGLAGIPPRRGRILRPLLAFGRADLKAWLEARGQTWVEDKTNQEAICRRNSLRLDIVPRLKDMTPGFLTNITRCAEILRAEEDYWQTLVEKLAAGLTISESQTEITVDRAGFAALSLAEKRRLVYFYMMRLWRARENAPEPISFNGISQALELLEAKTHRGLDLPGGLRLETTKKIILFALASRFTHPHK